VNEIISVGFLFDLIENITMCDKVLVK